MADILTDNGFHLGPKLGEGTYAKVRCVERQRDGTIFAAKIFDRKKASSQRSDFLKRFLPRELKIVTTLNNPYLVSTHVIIQKEHFVFVIMDYAEKGDLLQLIRQGGAMVERDVRGVMWQVAQAINYLHDRNIAHRDLKCENVLIKKDKRIVISDFGFARSVASSHDPKRTVMSDTYCGSAAYASPELLQGNKYDPKPNDIWSFGVLTFVVATGFMPYNETQARPVLIKQQSEQLPFPLAVTDRIENCCKKFIWFVLEFDWKKRPTIKQIIDANWLYLDEIWKKIILTEQHKIDSGSSLE